MALGYIGYNLMLMENRINHIERRVERQLLRMTENPFDLTNCNCDARAVLFFCCKTI